MKMNKKIDKNYAKTVGNHKSHLDLNKSKAKGLNNPSEDCTTTQGPYGKGGCTIL